MPKPKVLLLVFVLLVNYSSTVLSYKKASCFKSTISFGDSIADTGNLLLMDKLTPSAYSPYGRTFFHHPTGRCCDGRLIIDFIAESLGLPLAKPYLSGRNGSEEFEKGVNFAVVGARAIDAQFFNDRGIVSSLTNVSLGDQLGWLKQFLATIPNSRKFLGSSFVSLGEIGGNDYNDPLIQGWSLENIKPLVPKVINVIGNVTEELINLGAQTILVPGNFPIGCIPIYTALFKTTDVKEYDSKTGCLNWLNEFAEYHNQLLQTELSRIRKSYPRVTIIYGDYYNAVMRLYLSPREFGFKGNIHKACCVAAQPCDINATCSCLGSYAICCCDDPSSFASWDGIHFTEATYHLVAQGLLEGSYTTPQLSTICTPSSRPRGIYDE